MDQAVQYKSRNPAVDSLKGFCAICVVIGHAANGFITSGIAGNLSIALFKTIYSFHMPLFFLISGYVFFSAYYDRDFTLKTDRFRRQIFNLCCLYILWDIIMWTFKYLMSAFVESKVTVRELLLIPVYPIQLHWYLYTLVIIYLLFSLLLRTKKLLLIGVLVTVMHAASYLLPENLPCQINSALFYSCFFFFGIVLKKSSDRFEKLPLWIGCLSVVAGTAVLIASWNMYSESIQTVPMLGFVTGILFSLFFWILFTNVPCSEKGGVLRLCGRYCLPIYLMHTYFVTALRTILPRINIAEEWLSIVIMSVVGVAFPVIITFIMKKIHIYDFFFNPRHFLKSKDHASSVITELDSV